LTRGGRLARILIAGGGPAGLEAALTLRGLLDPEDQVELVAEGDEFVYRPLAVAEPFGRDRPERFPLTPLVELCGARHRRDLLVEVDVDAREAGLASGASVLYDALLVAVGARAVAALPDAITFWGAGGDPDFVHALEGLRQAGGEITFVVPHRVAWSLPLYAFDAVCLRGKCEEDPVLGYELMKRFTPVIVERLQATRVRLLDVYGHAATA